MCLGAEPSYQSGLGMERGVGCGIYLIFVCIYNFSVLDKHGSKRFVAMLDSLSGKVNGHLHKFLVIVHIIILLVFQKIPIKS